MTREEFHAIVTAFPGVEEAPSYGQPSYKVNGKFFTRVRKDDASAVIMEVPFDERDLLLEVEPETFHFTAHYKDYPCVLARLKALNPDQLKGFLERRWRKSAKKAEVKAWDASKKSAHPREGGDPGVFEAAADLPEQAQALFEP